MSQETETVIEITPTAIKAAQSVNVYLVKEGIYLDERQAEQVAIAVSEVYASLQSDVRRLVGECLKLGDEHTCPIEHVRLVNAAYNLIRNNPSLKPE